jgi:hypothetical protein
MTRPRTLAVCTAVALGSLVLWPLAVLRALRAPKLLSGRRLPLHEVLAREGVPMGEQVEIPR